MKFQARVIPSGNATAVEAPAEVLKALAAGPRPAIAVTVNGHTWRSRIALKHGKAPVRAILAGSRPATEAVGTEICDCATIVRQGQAPQR